MFCVEFGGQEFAFSYRQSAACLSHVCAAKHDVRFTIFWEFVIADHVYHKTTSGQSITVTPQCNIVLKHDRGGYRGRSLWRAYRHLQPLDPWICKWTIIRIRDIPKPMLPSISFCVLCGEVAPTVVQFIRGAVLINLMFMDPCVVIQYL